MEYAYDVILQNLSNDVNKELLINSQETFINYVDYETELMYSAFYANSNTSEYMGDGSNYVYEQYSYIAELYKSRCNKLFEYIYTITGKIQFYHDDIDMKELY